MDLFVYAFQFIVGTVFLFYGLCFAVWACLASFVILKVVFTELIDYCYKRLHPLQGINK